MLICTTVDSSDDSAELLMKSAMLTDSNKTEMAEAHKKTFSIRKAWIDNKNKKPKGKEVVERFLDF